MKSVRYVKTVFLFIVLITFIGCGSKQDKAGTSAVSTRDKTGEKPVSPQDKTDARAAAARFHSQIQAGDFSAIYKESAPGFKKFGTESQFVSSMQDLRQKTGLLKNATEIEYINGKNPSLGKSVAVIFNVQYDKAQHKQTLSFARSKSGKMELCGIDEEL
jgi:hypothetical protein